MSPCQHGVVRYLPILLDVAGRPALVVGAGPEGRAKIARLAAAGAAARVVGVEGPRPLDLPQSAIWLARPFADGDLEGACVVFVDPAAVDDGTAARLVAWSRERNVPLCVLDRPEHSTFANPAVADAGGVVVAVSTEGASPGLAKRLRERLEAALGGERMRGFVARLAAVRAGLARGERAERGAAALDGFDVEVAVRFPPWFEEGRDAPE